FTLANASHTGPTGQIAYKFEIADSSSFSHIVATGTVNEQGGGRTSLTLPSTALNNGATYYWRAQATDVPSGTTSPISAVASFTFFSFNMAQAIMVDAPPDLGSWAETAKITGIDFSSGQILVDFDRRDGPN